MPPVARTTAIAELLPSAGTLAADASGRTVALAVLTSLAALTWLMHRAGLVIAATAPATVLFAVGFGALGLVAAIGHRSEHRRVQVIGTVAHHYAVFILIGLIGAVGSYPVAALSHGYADAALQRIDIALGFDWNGLYQLTADSRLLQLIGRAAYQSIYASPAVLLVHYALTARRGAADRFLLTVWTAAALTLVLFRFMPAVGPFAYLWHGPAPYLPTSELWQPQLIPLLRAHQWHVVDLGHLVGLVSAPSFHTAAAVLLIAFAWPHRHIRLVLVPLNLLMILSIPVEGTHYLSDMLLGAGVALVALYVAPYLPRGVRAISDRLSRLAG